MKFEKMSIECESQEDKLNVVGVLNGLGYSCNHNNFSYSFNLFIHTYEHGSYQGYCSNDNHEGVKILTSSQFLSKYSNQFHEKIKQAMSDFGLNREELSMKLGYSAPYITKMLTLPQSEKVKKKVVEKIDNLYQSKKSIGTLVVDLEQSPEFKKVIAGTKTEIEKVAEENEKLKKELDHKNQVLDKRNDLFKNAEYEVEQLNYTVNNLQIVLNEKTDEVEGVKAAFELVAKLDNKRIAELETLNKQLGVDLSKRNKDVKLLNFGCVVLGLIVLVMVCFW